MGTSNNDSFFSNSYNPIFRGDSSNDAPSIAFTGIPAIGPHCPVSPGQTIRVTQNTCSHQYPAGMYLTVKSVDFVFHERGNWRINVREGAYYVTLPDIELVHGRMSYGDDSVPKKQKKFDVKKMDALVIAPEVKEEIIAVLEQHQNYKKLFDEWGLGEVIEYGRGMTFMFYGGPGTGKTHAARCMAKAIGCEMIVLSASEIQSSEPGGAERAIQQAFTTATEEDKVIFLDECDSLISSRNDLGMVLASEVNTLLTEIEKFEGVAILATNRIEHMDEALERRISLIVEFPRPDFEARKTIWAQMLPKKMPLGPDVSVDNLAKHELTGGQIKNVVLQAARMALAAKSETVAQKHFDMAVTRINKSKNLMGTASHYRQGRVRDDFSMGSGTKTKGLKDFFKSQKKDELL